MSDIDENVICPYVGLRPFYHTDRKFFFGRESSIRIITSNLHASPFTIMYGDSGVGKSSVLMAGVLPQLKNSGQIAIIYREWQKTNFITRIKSQLIDAYNEFSDEPYELDPYETDIPLNELVFDISQKRNQPVFIVLDQFEEYFVYDYSENNILFESELAKLVNRPEIQASVLLIIREDNLSKIDQFRTRIPNLLGNTLQISNLDSTAAERAIKEPLKVFNDESYLSYPIDIQEELVAEIINQVQSGAVQISEVSGAGGIDEVKKKKKIETPFLQLVLMKLWETEIDQGSSVLRLSTLINLGGAQEIVRSHLKDTMESLKLEEKEVCAELFDRFVTPSGTKIACTKNDLRKWSGSLSNHLDSTLNTLTKARILKLISTDKGPKDSDSYEIYHDVLALAVLSWKTKYAQDKETEAAEKRAEDESKRSLKLKRILVSMAIISVIAISAAGYALVQRNSAIMQSIFSSSRELATSAYGSLRFDPELGILLSLQSARSTYDYDGTITPESEEVLRAAIRASRIRKTITGHEAGIYSGVFSPDGSLIATASEDSTARIWIASSGEELLKLSGHQDQVMAVSFSQDGKFLATASIDSTVILWDVETGNRIRTFEGHAGYVVGVTFSPNDSLLATASFDRTARIWDVRTGEVLREFRGHSDWVRSVDFFPDGKRLLTTSKDQYGAIWHLDSIRPIRVFDGHTEEIIGGAIDPAGNRVATAGLDRTAIIWDANTGQRLSTLRGHTSTIWQVAFDPNNRFIATASLDSKIKLWRIDGEEIANFGGHTNQVFDVSFSPDGELMVSSSRDGTAKIWRTASSGEELLTLPVSDIPEKAYDIHFSPTIDNRLLLVGIDVNDFHSKVYDSKTGNLLFGLDSYDAQYSKNGEEIVGLTYNSYRKKIEFWNAGNSENLSEFPFEGQQFALHPFQRELLSVKGDTLNLYNIDTGDTLLTLPTEQYTINNAAFNRFGSVIASLSPWSVILWDVNSGQELIKLEDRREYTAISFSPTSDQIAIGHHSGAVAIMDYMDSTNTMLDLYGHRSIVKDVKFSPNGLWVASASSDGTIKLWDASTGQNLLNIRNDGFGRGALRIAISADSRLLAVLNFDKTVNIFTLDKLDLLRLARNRITRSLSREECFRYFNSQECPPLFKSLEVYLKGKNLAQNGNIQDATKLFEEALSIDPGMEIDPSNLALDFASDSYFSKANFYLTNKRIDEAVVSFEKASLTNDDNNIDKTIALLLRKESENFFKEADYKAAILSLEAALEFDSDIYLDDSFLEQLCKEAELAGIQQASSVLCNN